MTCVLNANYEKAALITLNTISFLTGVAFEYQIKPNVSHFAAKPEHECDRATHIHFLQ